MSGGLPSYAVVSPVRDEGAHLARTIRSVVEQHHRPERWVIVDDGSEDDTASIAAAACEHHDWITLVRRERSGHRGRGAPIVEAFNAGLERVDVSVDFVVKLDGDLFLPAHYFQWVAEVFARNPRAGMVGGVIHMPTQSGEWVRDTTARHVLSGAIKAYRSECLEDIGGLVASMGWDGMDEYAARSRGWLVHVLTELVVLHYKPRGSKQRWWIARWEEGAGAAAMSYLPVFVLVRTLRAMLVDAPPVLGGLALLGGYVAARLRRRRSPWDDAAIAELHREQGQRLRRALRGGHAVVPRLEGGGPAFWT